MNFFMVAALCAIAHNFKSQRATAHRTTDRFYYTGPLRMMNKFAEARGALAEAEKFIDELLAKDPDDKECLAIKSLIIFRKGEIAQTLNERADAKRFYQESLALDSKTGDHEGDQLVKRLIEEVG